MDIFWLVVSFLAGVTLTALFAWVMSLKTKGFTRIVFNSLAGITLLLCFSLLKIIYIPLNPLNALVTGFLGIPGLVVIILIMKIL